MGCLFAPFRLLAWSIGAIFKIVVTLIGIAIFLMICRFMLEIASIFS